MRDFLLDLGIEPDQIFRDIGLSSAADAELEPAIPIADICRPFDLVAAQLDRPYFGLDLARG